MLKWFYHWFSEFPEQLDIMDSIGQHFLMEKMAL